MAVLRNLCKYKEPIQNKRAVKANSILQSLKTWLNGLWCSFLINYRFIITCLNEIFILLSDIGGNNSLGQTSDIIIIFFWTIPLIMFCGKVFVILTMYVYYIIQSCSELVMVLLYTCMHNVHRDPLIKSWNTHHMKIDLEYGHCFFFILIYIIFLHECSLIQNKTNNYTQEIKWHELDCVSKEKNHFLVSTVGEIWYS